MKLLIVAQVVDIDHPVLGFFHKWIATFAASFDELHVIALQVGEYNLPANVHVYSLGKETGAGKFMYFWRFFKYVFTLKYDHVFVHMNAEYVILAGWYWRLLGKRVGLWYNHTIGSLFLRLSTVFVNVHMHTSPYAYPARYEDSVIMPAGVNEEVFRAYPEITKVPGSIYFQGRVAPAKRVHILLEAFDLLQKERGGIFLTIVGPEDNGYVKVLKKKYASYIKNQSLVFMGPMPHKDTAVLFAKHAVSVNLTDDGNYDKTVLESLLCGTPVIVSSKAFKGIVPEEWTLFSPEAGLLAKKLGEVLEKSPVVSTNLKETHSLATLSKALVRIYEA